MCFVLAEEGLDMTRIKHEVGQYMSQLAQKQLCIYGVVGDNSQSLCLQ